MSRIECSTLFDITETRVTGHYRPDRLPFVDRSGKTITTEQEWHHSRNQQRNWETLMQILSLRSQIDAVTHPDQRGKKWVFEFSVEHDDIFGTDDSPFSVLESDSLGVPMVSGLSERSKIKSVLEPNTNIWFKRKEQ